MRPQNPKTPKPQNPTGMQINYYSIYFFKFLNDIKELKKTLFSSVSRLINCIYDKIRAGAKEKSGVQ